MFEQKEQVNRERAIKSYKVQWSNHSEEEATWETEVYLRAHFPEFLPSTEEEIYTYSVWVLSPSE